MMMKNFLLIIALLACIEVQSQDETIMREYGRSTIANLTLSFGDQSEFEEQIMYGFRNLVDMPKYNISEVSLTALSLPMSRDQIYARNSGIQRSKALTDRLRRLVQNAGEFFPPQDSFGLILGQKLSDRFNIGGKMLYEWSERDDSGNYPVIRERTNSNLTLEDLRTNVDPAKVEVFAQNLRSNYVIVYDINRGESNTQISGTGQNRVSSESGGIVPGQNGDGSVTAIVNAYVYKVKISDELFKTFIRPKFNDRVALRDHPYDLEYIGRTAVRTTFSPREVYQGMRTVSNIRNNGVLGALTGKKKTKKHELQVVDKDQQGFEQNIPWASLDREQRDTFTMNELTRLAFRDVLNLLEMNVEAFKVRTGIMGSSPIIAAIGKREGLRADQRYRVYQNVLRGDSVITRSVGVIRAVNRVADNMESRFAEDGTPLISEFRQVYGDGIREGMYMVQENDYGLGFSVGPTIGYFGSPLPRMVWTARGYYNASRTANKILGSEKVFGLSAFVGLGFGTRSAEDLDGNFTAFVYEFGLEKKLYFHHKFDLIPEFGLTIYAPGQSSGLEAEFADNGALYLAPGIKGLFKVSERSGVILGLRVPLQIADIPYENPASFLHFDLRGRTSF